MAAGIIKGDSDGGFRPNEFITRAEIAAIIARALDLPQDAGAVTSFKDDNDIPQWAKSSVDAAQRQGILSGRSGNYFVPNDKATRAEAVVILLKALSQS